MKKRLTDTEIWEKPWFRILSPIDKCAIMFIKDRCDNVGVWIQDKVLAEFYIGGEIDWKTLPDRCNGNIEILDNGKWWLKDFCEFQYGELCEDTNNKARLSYVYLLKKHGLWGRVRGLGGDSEGTRRPLVGAQEKEKDKDKDKDKKKTYAQDVTLLEKEYQTLTHDYGGDITKLAIEELSIYKQTHGRRYKSDYGAILTWVIGKVTGKDRQTVKAEQAAGRERAEKKHRYEEDIKNKKVEKLPEGYTKELIDKVLASKKPP